LLNHISRSGVFATVIIVQLLSPCDNLFDKRKLYCRWM